MSAINPPTPNPCASCPYRRDVPSGVWAEGEYDILTRFDADMHEQPPSLFLCHQNDYGNGDQLCAGWVACHGPYDLLGLRIAVSRGDVDASVMDYTTKVAVFDSGVQAAEHGKRDLEHPSREAMAMADKIARRRKGVRYR